MNIHNDPLSRPLSRRPNATSDACEPAAPSAPEAASESDRLTLQSSAGAPSRPSAPTQPLADCDQALALARSLSDQLSAHPRQAVAAQARAMAGDVSRLLV